LSAARSLAFVLLVPVVCSGCTNFYEVDRGKLYRSAQLSGPQLASLIERHGIRSVINLRGPNPGRAWYDAERVVTERLKVEQIDIPMSAGRLPYRRDLLKLLDAFDRAPKPILVHCLAGADRTGEAVGIYMIDHMGRTPAEALGALTPATFHFEFLHPTKRQFIRNYGGRDWARCCYKKEVASPSKPTDPQTR
jgi:protein tyrosine phosphatase (PTP) superfamily phosphohydrolase (DUF442 family)